MKRTKNLKYFFCMRKPFCTYGNKYGIVREFNVGFLNGKA